MEPESEESCLSGKPELESELGKSEEPESELDSDEIDKPKSESAKLEKPESELTKFEKQLLVSFSFYGARWGPQRQVNPSPVSFCLWPN